MCKLHAQWHYGNAHVVGLSAGAIVGCNGLAEGFTRLIVCSMTGGSLLCLVEPSVDVLVGGNLMDILLGAERSHQDGIAAVQGNHDVLVATVGARWESVSVISEDAGYRDV